jgi:phage terminase Nu1 subunit (DNA packaging protein)
MLKRDLEENIRELTKRVRIIEEELCTIEWERPSEKTKRFVQSVGNRLGKLIPTITTRNIPKVKVRW